MESDRMNEHINDPESWVNAVCIGSVLSIIYSAQLIANIKMDIKSIRKRKLVTKPVENWGVSYHGVSEVQNEQELSVGWNSLVSISDKVFQASHWVFTVCCWEPLSCYMFSLTALMYRIYLIYWYILAESHMYLVHSFSTWFYLFASSNWNEMKSCL